MPCAGSNRHPLNTERRNHTFLGKVVLQSSTLGFGYGCLPPPPHVAGLSLQVSAAFGEGIYLQPVSPFIGQAGGAAKSKACRNARWPLSAGGSRLLVRLDPNRKPRTGTSIAAASQHRLRTCAGGRRELGKVKRPQTAHDTHVTCSQKFLFRHDPDPVSCDPTAPSSELSAAISGPWPEQTARTYNINCTMLALACAAVLQAPNR